MLRKGGCCEFDRLLFVRLLSTIHWALSCIWCNYKSVSAPQFPPVQVSCLSASASTGSLLTHLRAGWQQRTFAAMIRGFVSFRRKPESNGLRRWGNVELWSRHYLPPNFEWNQFKMITKNNVQSIFWFWRFTSVGNTTSGVAYATSGWLCEREKLSMVDLILD